MYLPTNILSTNKYIMYASIYNIHCILYMYKLYVIKKIQCNKVYIFLKKSDIFGCFLSFDGDLSDICQVFNYF